MLNDQSRKYKDNYNSKIQFIKEIQQVILQAESREEKSHKTYLINDEKYNEEIKEVKKLEEWEQSHKMNSLGKLIIYIDFYIFKLTNKIKSKIMKEDKEPTINLKNINYINMVEHYQRPGRKLTKVKEPFAKSVSTSIQRKPTTLLGNIENSNSTMKDYFKDHLYMMRGKILDNFKKNMDMPFKEKKLIEQLFSKEYKELNTAAKEIKIGIGNLFAESNELHSKMEQINESSQVIYSHYLIERRNQIQEKNNGAQQIT